MGGGGRRIPLTDRGGCCGGWCAVLICLGVFCAHVTDFTLVFKGLIVVTTPRRRALSDITVQCGACCGFGWGLQLRLWRTQFAHPGRWGAKHTLQVHHVPYT